MVVGVQLNCDICWILLYIKQKSVENSKISLFNVKLIIKLAMHSSMSFNSNRDKGPKKLDFHKDIITPNIYANQNFELLKNNSYPARHERKVITAKKAKIKSMIEGIVSKKQVQVSKKTALYQHRLSRPAALKAQNRGSSGFAVVQHDNFLMDIDQKLNQKALYYDQQSKLAEQKFRETMQKVLQTTNKKQQEQKQCLNFYITQLSPKKTHIPLSVNQIYISSIPKTYKGYVQAQQQIQKNRELRNRKQILTKTQMTIKPRPQTAGASSNQTKNKSQTKSTPSHFRSTLFRNNSLMNSKLSRFQLGTDVIENLKAPGKFSQEKQKIKDLFSTIQDSCLENTMSKGTIITEMNKLSMVWKTEKEFLDHRPSVTVMQISRQTLDLLKSIRRQQRQISKLDQKYVKQNIQTPKK